MLVQPIDQVLHENVMPWMLDKVLDFLGEDDLVDLNVDEVCNDAYELGKYMHSQSVMAEYKRRNDLIEAERQRVIQKELDRQHRREERERRRKREELDKFRAQVKQAFVDRGDIRANMAQQDLVEINGFYERGRPFFGTLGGELMQLVYILEAIAQTQEKEEHKQEESKKPHKNIRDLLSSHGLINFLLNYIKDMKNDTLLIQIS